MLYRVLTLRLSSLRSQWCCKTNVNMICTTQKIVHETTMWKIPFIFIYFAGCESPSWRAVSLMYDYVLVLLPSLQLHLLQWNACVQLCRALQWTNKASKLWPDYWLRRSHPSSHLGEYHSSHHRSWGLCPYQKRPPAECKCVIIW